MIAINTGTIAAPGARTWLAGSPFGSVNDWSPEYNVINAPERKVVRFEGASWAHAQQGDMGNAFVTFSFETRRAFADYLSAVAFEMAFGEAGPWSGMLERLIPDPSNPGYYRVWKAEGVTLKSNGPVVIGSTVTVVYHAFVPYWSDQGREIPTADVMGDGAGNTMVDGAGNTLVPSS